MGSSAIDVVEVARAYDESTPMSDSFNDGQVHLSYWMGAHDDTPMVEASRRLTRKVAASLGLRRDEHLLDAGCGLGSPAILIAEEFGSRVTGINVSKVQVDEAERRAAASGVADRVRFRHGDYMSLSFPDDSFDGVLAMESLQCAPDLGQVLRELFRVLRPGGIVALSDLTMEDGWSLAEAERYAESMNINRMPSMPEWLAALRAAGFEIEEYTQCGHRVLGPASRYRDAAEESRDALVASCGEASYTGMVQGMGMFLAPGPTRLGYAIISARKPVG